MTPGTETSLTRVIIAALVASCGASAALAQGGQMTSPRPEFRSCDPGAELARSGAASFSVPLDLTHGLTIGRSNRAPFTASARSAAMLSVLPRTRRLLVGPVAGIVYTNPSVEGLLGGRLAYRVWSLGLHQGLDLGTRGDVVVEGGWETGGSGVASAGFVLDLSLLRLATRATYDVTRDDVRLELGVGRTLLARRKDPPSPSTPPQTRWYDAQREFQAMVRVGISQTFNEAEPVDTTLPPWERPVTGDRHTELLCDQQALRRLARRAPELERSAPTLDDIVRVFRQDSLLRLAARLEARPTRWRSLAVEAAAQPPPTDEREAVRALMRALRLLLVVEYGVSRP